MSNGLIAVTGATGYLGGGAARRLLTAGVTPRLVVRDRTRLTGALADVDDVREATYADAAAMTAALEGVDTLYLVSAAEDAHWVDLHVSAVDAARAAGVSRIVYSSFVHASPDATFTFVRDHFATEVHIRSTGVEHTFLRSSLYVDFLPGMVGDDGVLRGPAGDRDGGRVSWVARDDICDVTARALVAAPPDEVYDVTGPAALTIGETVALLSEVTGREITYVDEGLDEARAARRAAYDAADFEIEGWITTYAAVAAGELDAVTDTVERIAGHPATSAGEWLRAHPESYARLTA
ncbi:NmrA family NAD(P)-binding protein [Jatrophihabitans sp. YIM 134969]